MVTVRRLVEYVFREFEEKDALLVRVGGSYYTPVSTAKVINAEGEPGLSLVCERRGSDWRREDADAKTLGEALYREMEQDPAFGDRIVVLEAYGNLVELARLPEEKLATPGLPRGIVLTM